MHDTCNSAHGIPTTVTIGEVNASASHAWRVAPFTVNIFLK